MAEPAALRGINPLEQPDRAASAKPAKTVAELQANIEGVPADGITFRGHVYRLAPIQGALPMVQFAWGATNGLNFEDPEGISAVFEVLRDCFVVAYKCEECADCLAGDPCPNEDLGDWPRFRNALVRRKADIVELVEMMQQAIELVNARPTQRPSDSSAGPPTTSPSSMEPSPSPAIPNGQAVERLYRVEDLLGGAVG